MEITIYTIKAALHYFTQKRNSLNMAIASVLSNPDLQDDLQISSECEQYLRNIYDSQDQRDCENGNGLPEKFIWWIGELHTLEKENYITIDEIPKPHDQMIEDKPANHLQLVGKNEKPPIGEVTMDQLYQFAVDDLKYSAGAEDAYACLLKNYPDNDVSGDIRTMYYKKMFEVTYKKPWDNKPNTLDKWLEHLVTTNHSKLELYR
jgi:hypothetical protein